MPVNVNKLVQYCHTLLDVPAFKDYCPNGLQVEGKSEIKKIVAGVTACQALLDAAVAADADLILVHHGYFWRSESPTVTGMKKRRLQTLLMNNINLLAYHLPLDAHSQLGNNVQLAQRLSLTLEPVSSTEKDALVRCGELAEPRDAQALSELLEVILGRKPLHIKGIDRPIKKLGLCTGAAQGYIEQALAQGCDAFISGEISESTVHIARELGIDYFAAGHHATERYGVQALGEHLAQAFDLEYEFIDIDNPV